LAEDVVKLCHPRGTVGERFVPLKCVAVDMFPHTVHLEMVVYLERYCPERHDKIYAGEADWVEKARAEGRVK